jgi:multidrug resistance efflux pump
MTAKQRTFFAIGLLGVAGAVAVTLGLRRSPLVLTGIVTTDETVVSSEISGRLQELSVAPGDHVKRGQLLGRIAAAEQQADLAYSDSLAQSAAAVVDQSAADLRFQTEMTAQQVAQAEAAVTQADADAELARANFERAASLQKNAINSAQDYDQARSANDAAKARAAAARAALGVARAGAAQVAVHQAALAASRQQLAAAASQKDKAGVRFGYTEIHAPVDGIVNLRAALPGEVVNSGQAIVTLVDPANLWVRADIEESYVDRLHLGDKLTVRLPSGAERAGTIFFRGVDAAYATQRDVSRTKRDIKTFELRLRCDNTDGSLAVGMTAYVVLPFAR